VIRPSLILLGLIIGIALGVVYGWLISPITYTDTAPSALRDDYQAQYIILTAVSYSADQDLDRARGRLAALGVTTPVETVTALAQRLAAEGKDSSAVAELALALGAGVSPVTLVPTSPTATTASVAATAVTETPIPPPTITAPPSSTSIPTLTPTLIPIYDYVLLSQESYCNDAERQPLIIVDVVDEAGAPLPGVRVSVKWAEGEDGFVTGLKPEIGAGYGDFLMEVGRTYSVQIGSRTPPVDGLSSPTCAAGDGSNSYNGAIRLVFQRK
jgi:hypothetical protein